MSSGKWIDNKTYIHKYSPKGAAVEISFGKGNQYLTDQRDATENDNKRRSDRDYYRRGARDNRLLLMHKIADDSPNKWQILETKANFIAGKGLVFLNEEEKDQAGFFQEIKTKTGKDWIKKLKLNDLLIGSAWQLAFADEFNWFVTLGTDGKIEKIRLIDNNDIRAKVLNKTETSVSAYLLSTDFGYRSKVQMEKVKSVPAFDDTDPKKYGSFILHYHLPKPGQKFYGFASWWGTEKWSEVSNKVPEYYDAMFKNGFFVTHQITVPEDYFAKENQTEEEELAAKKTWIDQVTETLSGVEDANKIVVTFKKMSSDGKTYMPGVEITPVANPIKDEAFIKMLEAGNLIQTSGHGLPGVLTAVQLSQDQGTSGKEVMALANYVQDFLMPIYRNTLKSAFEVIKDIDGVEPDLDIAVGRISSYTFDSTPQTDISNPKNNV